jgi:hypothetical protein
MTKQAGAHPPPTKTNTWYLIDTSDPEYFFAQTVNKNGGLSGLKVTERGRSAKAVKYNTGALDKRPGAFSPYKELDEKDVPEKVIEAARDKGAKIASVQALTLRVATRFLCADQPPGMRKDVKDILKPVNSPKGISREIVKEHGQALEEGTDESVAPNRRDLRPQDLFFSKPDQVSVRNLAETGKDLSRAINKQIPKDEGYDSVSNLSQYLVNTSR